MAIPKLKLQKDIPEPTPVKCCMSEKERGCKASCSNCENDSRKTQKCVPTGRQWWVIYQKSSSLLELPVSGCIASLPPVNLIFSMRLSRWNWLLHRTLSALLWRIRCNTFRSILWNASCSIWWAMALGDIPTHRGLQSSKGTQFFQLSLFKRDSLPPTTWLGKGHNITTDDVTCDWCGCLNGIV